MKAGQPVEYYQAVCGDAVRVAADAAYVAGRLKSALEAHLIWLDTLANKLAERDLTRERRRAIILKEAKHLNGVLEDAWISRT